MTEIETAQIVGSTVEPAAKAIPGFPNLRPLDRETAVQAGKKFRNVIQKLEDEVNRCLHQLETQALKPFDRTSLVRAVDILLERLRILRGKPLPGNLRPNDVGKRRASSRPLAFTNMPPEKRKKVVPQAPAPAPSQLQTPQGPAVP